MKNTVLVLLFIVPVLALTQSSMFYVSVEDLTVISEDIIEGEVISLNSHWDDKKRHIYNENV